jgi:anthranilate synthase/aminodeoxychorismate synthase-like glutamine amidotransferase
MASSDQTVKNKVSEFQGFRVSKTNHGSDRAPLPFSLKPCNPALIPPLNRYNKPVVFVLDNYDSFTYNLVQYIGELGAQVEVRRNDEVTVQQIEAMHPERIVLSPGPCTPQEAGISIELIRHFAGKGIPLLGVCLGHQAIGAAFGGRVVRAKNLMHGKTSRVEHDGKTIFRGLSSPMTATRYHSLIVAEDRLPEDLEVSAWTRDGDGTRVIMGLRHRKFPVEGVQFHPESVLTNEGKKLVANFLRS